MILVKQLYQNTKDLSVLYVEDDDQLRNQMGMMFDELFNHVELAENGLVGIEKYRQKIQKDEKPYDLVVTDVNMPKMNGIDLIKDIYAINPLQPVVVMSAHNETHYLLELLHIGVNSFLLKPTQHNVLINTLYTITQGIVNERLLKSHYRQIEELNAQLALQSDALKKSNEELRDKNIALEKSMRIIEGMHHKDQLQHGGTFISQKNENPIPKKVDEEPSEESSALQCIDDIINEIALTYHYKGIETSYLEELSNVIRNYIGTLEENARYTTLVAALGRLASVVSEKPKCTTREELERIFSMLESFFFIYAKWQEKWNTLDDNSFESFSRSIADEVNILSDVWQCKV